MFPNLTRQWKDQINKLHLLDQAEFLKDYYELYLINPVRFIPLYILGVFIAMLVSLLTDTMYSYIILILILVHIGILANIYLIMLERFKQRWSL